MILIAAAPILPLLLVFGVGAGMFALVASAKSSNKGLTKPVVKSGVEYGAQCSYIKVIDPMKVFEATKDKIIAVAQSLTEDMLAIDAMAKMMAIAFPGPGCDYSDPEFNTTLFTGHGEQFEWRDIRDALGSKTLLEATNDGTFQKYMGTGAPLANQLLYTQGRVVHAILKMIKPPLAPSPYNPPAPLKWAQDRQFYSVLDHFMKKTYYVVLIKDGGGYRWEMFHDPAVKQPVMVEGLEGVKWSDYGTARLKPLDTLLDAMGLIQMGGPVFG